MVVKGAAGTGKTIVGVRRIEWLLHQPGLFAEPKPILYVCYNQVLRQAVLSMLGISCPQIRRGTIAWW